MSRHSHEPQAAQADLAVAPVGTGTAGSAAMTVSAAGRDTILQAKMTVGAANDPLEREADAIADRFMSGGGDVTSEPAVSSAEASMVQRSADDMAGSFGAPDIAEQHINATRGSGSPLPEIFRTKMETMTGADLASVRIHTDPGSAEAAASVGAKAFTVGSDIYFGADGSPSDPHLLAHETAHVVQQG